jgi:hypothetical protein
MKTPGRDEFAKAPDEEWWGQNDGIPKPGTPECEEYHRKVKLGEDQERQQRRPKEAEPSQS